MVLWIRKYHTCHKLVMDCSSKETEKVGAVYVHYIIVKYIQHYNPESIINNSNS